jgi:hypothetical protein
MPSKNVNGSTILTPPEMARFRKQTMLRGTRPSHTFASHADENIAVTAVDDPSSIGCGRIISDTHITADLLFFTVKTNDDRSFRPSRLCYSNWGGSLRGMHPLVASSVLVAPPPQPVARAKSDDGSTIHLSRRRELARRKLVVPGRPDDGQGGILLVAAAPLEGLPPTLGGRIVRWNQRRKH